MSTVKIYKFIKDAAGFTCGDIVYFIDARSNIMRGTVVTVKFDSNDEIELVISYRYQLSELNEARPPYRLFLTAKECGDDWVRRQIEQLGDMFTEEELEQDAAIQADDDYAIRARMSAKEGPPLTEEEQIESLMKNYPEEFVC